MNFSYAIFDLDGTLLDSMTYWRNNIALFAVKEKGYDVSKQTEEKTYGMYADKAMALWNTWTGDNAAAEEAARQAALEELKKKYKISGPDAKVSVNSINR